jgi:predicted amidophosphoribosyltransferase
MSGYQEPGVCLVSWRSAASTVHLCGRCRRSYSEARFCDGCLRQVNADPCEKRGILFPAAHDGSDAVSTVA